MTTAFAQLARRLSRRAFFSLVVAVTIALGVGASVTAFAVVHSVLISPLPFPDADQLFALWHRAPAMGIEDFEQAEETYVLYRERGRAWEHLGLYRPIQASLTGDGDPEKVPATEVTAPFFAALSVPPAAGRWIQDEDEVLGAPLVTVLSDALWTRRYGRDPNIVGTTIEVDSELREVVGIMPPGFVFPEGSTELWIPRQIDRATIPNLNFSYSAIGRLAAGTTTATADAELNRILAELPTALPGGLTTTMIEDAEMAAFVRPLKEVTIGDAGSLLTIVGAAAVLLLLVTLVNVLNLFLVRAEEWRGEAMIRRALGAGMARAITPLVSESVLLATAGGILGLLMASVSLDVLVAHGPERLPRIHEIELGQVTAAAGMAIAVASGLLVGLVSAGSLHLRRGSREAIGEVRGRTPRKQLVLVTAEVALSVVLLVGSGLMIRTFLELRNVDPGFDADGVVSLRLTLPEAAYEGGDISLFYDQLTQAISEMPGIEAVGTVGQTPLSRGFISVAYVIEDAPPGPGDVTKFVLYTGATGGYFRAMGIPLLQGRDFTQQDHVVPNHVAIVSRAFAEAEWPGQDPIGKRFARGNPNQRADWMTVVGVVGDVRNEDVKQPPAPAVYFPVDHPSSAGPLVRFPDRHVVVRASAPTSVIAPELRRAVWALDPNLPIIGPDPFSRAVATSVAETTFITTLLGATAAVTLLLGTIGLYGVLSYAVSRRFREIGIRMSVGATTRSVRRMVLRQGMTVAILGTVLGLAASAALGRVIQGFLFGLDARDPLTFFLVAVVLLVVAALATDRPARRAGKIDPVRALKAP